MAKKIYSQDPERYNLALAAKLKEKSEFQVPEWANFVKSGTSRERPPTQVDFWYLRAASILRQLYIKGVVGVNKLRSRYGSRKDRGTNPDEFRKGGGKIIRVILQQAENAGLVEKVSHLQFGRRLTPQGRDFLDSISVEEKEFLDLSSVLIHESSAQRDLNEDDSAENEDDDQHTDDEDSADMTEEKQDGK